jgi:hypothetical protein
MNDASKLIDQKIASIRDWRGERMREIRELIREVDPAVIEEWKWMGTPVWNHDGIICCVNAHSRVVKMTFLKGAQVEDPRRIFNAELAGNARRAINWAEGDPLDVEGVKGLVLGAIAINQRKPSARKAGGASSVTAKPPGKKRPAAKKKKKR